MWLQVSLTVSLATSAMMAATMDNGYIIGGMVWKSYTLQKQNLQPLHRFNLCTHILTHIDYRVSLVSILFNRSHNFSSQFQFQFQFQFMWVSVTSPTTTKSPQLERKNKQKEREGNMWGHLF
jgi:hypothetical protein